jgi:antagonist of KipI
MPDRARIRVIRPGLLSTVQDLGRVGLQRFGVAVSGAMDPLALRAGNRLVGNPDAAACLEMTIQGPDLEFLADALVAVTGADLSPVLDSRPVALWTTVAVTRGSRLTFGPRRSGARAYLAIAGGLDTPFVLGSRSTHTGSRTGGLHGRALERDDILECAIRAPGRRSPVGRNVPEAIRPLYSASPTLRAVPGPQADRFPDETFQTLLTTRYRLLPQSDRMGYRLAGAALVHTGSPDIVSDATPPGAVQVPANQQPILLMADRQTTGGYAKIVVVVTADLPLAAQLIPGDSVGFTLLDVAEAQTLLRQQWMRLNQALPPSA